MEAFKFRPIRGRVIVQAIEDPDIQNGIVVIDRLKEMPTTGIVKSVGKGRITRNGVELPMPFKPGDQVRFDGLAGQSITLDDEKYLIIDEEKLAAMEGE